jgi:ankyrin repeat protein
MSSPKWGHPSINLPAGWRREQKDGLWHYYVNRLPLGWVLRYASDGSPYFHNTIQQYCTRIDPRIQHSHPSNFRGHVSLGSSKKTLRPLRKAYTQESIAAHLRRSSTVPCAANVFDQYSHEPLVASTAIRLLKWLGKDESGIPSFAVEQHDIEHTPPYVALSYTWGNPFPESDETDATYSTSYQWPVLCNGKVLCVTKNLHDFLHNQQPQYDDSNDSVGGGTALHYAAHRGRLETVINLLAIGADLNSRDAMDRTPLFLACWAEHEAIVKFLLSQKANTELGTNAAFGAFCTPLFVAVARNNIPIAEALLAAGASTETRLETGLTALHLAVMRKNYEMSRFLLSRGSNLETRTKNADKGHTPLFTAAANADLACVQLLVEYGATLDTTNEYKQTALHAATNAHAIDIVRYLLRNGANPLVCSIHTGWTPLHDASAHGLSEIVLDLIKAGSDLELTEIELERSALSLACEFDNLENVRCLLDNGAAINTRRSDGCTPLHMAAWRQSVAVVGELLERGANALLVNNQGQTALHKASGSPAVAHKEDLDDEVLFNKLAVGRLEVIKLLLSGGIDVNSLDSSGLTPLHCSTISGYSTTVILLLKSGAFINQPSKAGDTPLMCAAARNNVHLGE